jgi:predicted ATP-grasp superfamily ATP-dependent carboligase
MLARDRSNGKEPSSSMRALVTDVHLRSAVAGMRGLGRGGVQVVALAPERTAAGMWSRYATARAAGPLALVDRAGFVEAVARAAAEHGPLVVYPGQEESIEALLAAWSQLPPSVILPYPERGPVAAIRDKRRLPALAEEVGLATVGCLATGTAGELAEAELALPCVIKSAEAVGSVEFTTVLETRAELSAFLASLPARQPLIAQERVPGGASAVSLVLGRDGAVVARFQQEMRRSWPAKAGPSSLAVSVEPDEALVGRIARLLTNIGFWGLAQVQLVGGRERPAPVDVNPRFYGSLPLALACGVNLPALWHAVACDEPTPSPQPYRVGVTYRWLEGDVTASLQGHPRRLFDRCGRPRVGAMWASDDPLPSGLMALDAVTSRVCRRVLRRR